MTTVDVPRNGSYTIAFMNHKLYLLSCNTTETNVPVLQFCDVFWRLKVKPVTVMIIEGRGALNCESKIEFQTSY